MMCQKWVVSAEPWPWHPGTQSRGWSCKEWSLFQPNNHGGHQVILPFCWLGQRPPQRPPLVGRQSPWQHPPRKQSPSRRWRSNVVMEVGNPWLHLKSKVLINLLQKKVLILSSVRVFMTKCFAFASICQDLSLGGCDRIHLFFWNFFFWSKSVAACPPLLWLSNSQRRGATWLCIDRPINYHCLNSLIPVGWHANPCRRCTIFPRERCYICYRNMSIQLLLCIFFVRPFRQSPESNTTSSHDFTSWSIIRLQGLTPRFIPTPWPWH